jgi:hypothetical protein
VRLPVCRLGPPTVTSCSPASRGRRWRYSRFSLHGSKGKTSTGVAQRLPRSWQLACNSQSSMGYESSMGSCRYPKKATYVSRSRIPQSECERHTAVGATRNACARRAAETLTPQGLPAMVSLLGDVDHWPTVRHLTGGIQTLDRCPRLRTPGPPVVGATLPKRRLHCGMYAIGQTV